MGETKNNYLGMTNENAHIIRRKRHSFLKTSENEPFTAVEITLTVLSIVLFVLTFPIAIIFSLIVLAEFERAVIFRLGHLKKINPQGPGIIFFLPCVDEWIRIDLRVVSYDVPSQQILTKDSVTVQVDAVVYYRIYDPLRSVIQVDNVHNATNRLAQTTLRNVAGTKRIIELLTEKDSVVFTIAAMLDEGTSPWGVKVERVEIKDVRLPPLLQRAMAAEAEAAREAQAKVAAAEGELNASQALKEAADVMSLNPVTLQLRYLQTLSLISGDQNHNVIFPFPVNLIRDFIDAIGIDENTDGKDVQPQSVSMFQKPLVETRNPTTSKSADTEDRAGPLNFLCGCSNPAARDSSAVQQVLNLINVAIMDARATENSDIHHVHDLQTNEPSTNNQREIAFNELKNETKAEVSTGQASITPNYETIDAAARRKESELKPHDSAENKEEEELNKSLEFDIYNCLKTTVLGEELTQEKKNVLIGKRVEINLEPFVSNTHTDSSTEIAKKII